MSELAYDNKADTWACGVLAFELLVGCPPFGMSSRDESINAILTMAPKIPTWLPPGAASFLKSALAKKAARRPTVSALLTHPWILSFLYVLQPPPPPMLCMLCTLRPLVTTTCAARPSCLPCCWDISRLLHRCDVRGVCWAWCAACLGSCSRAQPRGAVCCA